MKLSSHLFGSLSTVACFTLSSLLSRAEVIFEAADSNVSLWNNSAAIADSSGSVSGDTGDGAMSLTVTGGNFSYAGFASTQNINTALGRSLTDSDTVVITLTTGILSDNGDGGELRSQGFRIGLSASTAMNGGALSDTDTDQLIIAVGGGGNSGNVRLLNSENAGPASGGGFQIARPSANDGLTVTLTADSFGWTASFADVSSTNVSLPVADLTGSFSPGQFTSFFGEGHLYAGFQQRFGEANGVTVPIEVASIEVVTFVDSDGDLIPDSYEIANGMDQDNAADANQGANDGLFDNDGLTNLEEYNLGTDPNLADTDGDLLNDGAEVNGTLNPYQVDHVAGSVPAGAPGEGTDPLKKDSDGDGLEDFVELDSGNGSVTNPKSEDTDGDGFTELFEIENGTAPDDADSFPVYPAISWSAQVFDAETDLSTEGTLFFAENFQGADVTVNGIPFTGRNTTNGGVFSTPQLETELGLVAVGIANIYDNEVPALTPLLADFWYISDPERSNFVLTGLTPGQSYLVEFGQSDDRTSGNIVNRYRQVDSFGGGSENDPFGGTNLTYGGSENPAILLSGRFTAVLPTQTFTYGVYDDLTEALLGSQLSFIQVREVNAVPQMLEITGIEKNGENLTLTWNSKGSERYSIFVSGDMLNWEAELDDNILPDPGNTTSRIFNLSDFGLANEPKIFFRVQATSN